MAESMLIFAPNANSYRRFRHQSYAPDGADLGHQQSLGQPARAGRRSIESTH